jgi:hypothetical protein
MQRKSGARHAPERADIQDFPNSREKRIRRDVASVRVQCAGKRRGLSGAPSIAYAKSAQKAANSVSVEYAFCVPRRVTESAA